MAENEIEDKLSSRGFRKVSRGKVTETWERDGELYTMEQAMDLASDERDYEDKHGVKHAPAPKPPRRTKLKPQIVQEDKPISGELVPVASEIVQPIVTADQAASMMARYIDLTKAVLTKDDYVQIKDKTYKKKSAWRKYARFFNLSDHVSSKKIEMDEDGIVTYAEFTVIVVAPNGRQSVGWGSCSASERKFAHPNHDLPATAHTRAKNRAISDIIGAGEVSAEEMQ